MRPGSWISSGVCGAPSRRARPRSEPQRPTAGMLVSLLAEVARNLFRTAGTQNRLAVARRNADNQRQTHLTNALLEGGRGTELDTSRAEAQLTSTLASIPLETVVKRAMYRLGVLIGQPPTALEQSCRSPYRSPHAQRRGLGRPEDLLRRRPDIRVTERNWRRPRPTSGW